MNRLLITVMAVAALATGRLCAQAAPATSPATLEVASIRPVQPYSQDEVERGLGNAPWSTFPTNHFVARHISLKLLVAISYGVNDNNIKSEAGDIDSQVYDLDAKVEANTSLSLEEMQPLLQNLLEERFHLKTHWATSTVSGYALTVTKAGSRLKAVKQEVSAPGMQKMSSFILPNGIQGRQMDLGGIAAALGRAVDAPVVDETGIVGVYDVKLRYAPPNAQNSSLPDVFTAVQEQLGLKLVARKVPIKTLIVDHADRVPTDN